MDAINDLNRLRQQQQLNPETATRIESYELAFRMQAAAPELLDDTLVIWGGEFGRTPMNEVRRGITPGKERP